MPVFVPVDVYAVSTRTARDISAPLGCAYRSSIRSVDQPPMSCTTRSEIPGDHRRRAGVAQDVVCEVVETNAAHQPAERHADGLLARRLAFPALTEDVALRVRVREELGAQLRLQEISGLLEQVRKEVDQVAGMAALRARAELATQIEDCLATMTPPGRRQFDTLMKRAGSAKR